MGDPMMTPCALAPRMERSYADAGMVSGVAGLAGLA